MLEDVIFGQITMPGEAVRIILAFLGTSVTAYYDVFNKKNIPDQLLFAFLAIAFIVNLVFYDATLFMFSIGITVFLSAIGYLFYRVGQLGGADLFVLAAIMLLLPIHPSYSGLPFNLPFIFSVFIFSGILFALYVLLYFGFKLTQVEAKPKLLYALVLIPYALFAYFFINSFLFSPVFFAFVTISIFATVFFMMFRDTLNQMLAEELPVSQLEPEDVLALEVMNKDMIERYKIPRLMNKDEIARLKKTKVGEVWVYTKLPPFVPFILLGMVLAMLFAKSLLLL
ncbi:MAG: prepilin peptidase [Candidatus Micrarchaeota archaeon]